MKEKEKDEKDSRRGNTQMIRIGEDERERKKNVFSDSSTS